MSISKEDYLEWKANKVTKVVLRAITKLIEEGKEELSQVAGENPASDNRRVGKLDGLRTFTDITYYDLEGEDE